MRRRDVLAAIIAVGPIPAAWSQSKIWRIGVLIDGSAPHPLPAALGRDLASLGYTEGRNAAFEVRYTDGSGERATTHAAELVALGCDVIVAYFTPAVRAAKSATQSIPVVMAPAGAPVEAGLVASLARPGANVTGVTNMAAELGGRRLQVLKDIIPELARVAVLASSRDPFTRPFLQYMQAAAATLAVELTPVMIGGTDEIADAFATMGRAGAQAAIVPAIFNRDLSVIVDVALRHRLPIMSIDREIAAAGGLVSLSADMPEIFRRVAALVDRIIRGADPGTIPVEQPTKFQLVVNMRTARQLGLTVPQSVLVATDEIIE